MKKFFIFYIKCLCIVYLFIALLFQVLGGLLTAFISLYVFAPTSFAADAITNHLSVLFNIDRNAYLANIQFKHWIDIFLISVHIFLICLIIYYIRNNWDK